jgi:hypothetical protein
MFALTLFRSQGSGTALSLPDKALPDEGTSPGTQDHNRKGPFEERFSAFLISYEAL